MKDHFLFREVGRVLACSRAVRKWESASVCVVSCLLIVKSGGFDGLWDGLLNIRHDRSGSG